ncbi:MAG TPA: hypothetical protein VIR50_03085 [Prevotella sp.]
MAQDSTTFKGYLYNEEYQVYLDIDFYHKNKLVPGQEIFGELPGYFGAKRDTRKWLITDISFTNSTTVQLSIINDYGSEDLTATLHKEKDGKYILKQGEGSTIKIAVNRKWVKIPKTLELIKK